MDTPILSECRLPPSWQPWFLPAIAPVGYTVRCTATDRPYTGPPLTPIRPVWCRHHHHHRRFNGTIITIISKPTVPAVASAARSHRVAVDGVVWERIVHGCHVAARFLRATKHVAVVSSLLFVAVTATAAAPTAVVTLTDKVNNG